MWRSGATVEVLLSHRALSTPEIDELALMARRMGGCYPTLHLRRSNDNNTPMERGNGDRQASVGEA